MKHDTVIHKGNNKYYYLNNEYHREDGPAVEFGSGDKEWYQNGQLHRDDGPAIEYSNGFEAWWYRGKWIDVNSQEEFEKIIKLKAFW